MSIKIKQHDYFDCGAVCISSVCAYYKNYISIAQVRQYANTDRKGTTVLGLVEACKKIGFNAKGVKATFEVLSDITMPAIAHVKLTATGSHFIVIYKITSKYVLIMDPEDGKMHKYSHQSFKEIWSGILVILTPEIWFTQMQAGVSKMRYYLNLILPHRKKITQILSGAIIYTLLGLGISIYVQKITDYVLPDINYNLLNTLSISIIIILLLQLFIGLVKNILSIKMGQLLDVKLILGYYKHLINLPQPFFDGMRIGEIVSRINDAVKIRTFINDVAVNAFLNLCIITFSTIIMFVYYWKLAIFMLLIIPIYVILYIISDRINQQQQRELMVASAELEAQLVESINAISTIKRFRLENYSNYKTETIFVGLLRRLYKSYLSNSAIGVIGDFFTKIFTVVLFWVGGAFVMKGEITPGELFSFYALLGFFTAPMVNLVNSNRQIQEAMIATDRLFEITDLKNESVDAEKKIELTSEMIGDIRFDKVSFRYGARVKIFEELSLTIPKGKISAIVGDSGSGKSTIAHLLQNIYSISNGHIYIGDCDLKYINNKSLRQLVGVVPQKIDLFSGTVIDNISIGDPEPDFLKIIELCKELGMLDFIEKLPDGFNTHIGENGTSLSGGQKQRIAIARALYNDPQIIIMDEATSSLDAFSNEFVKNTLETLRLKMKTIIIITHKLRSIQTADHIFFIKNGLLVEEGRHQELLNMKNNYYKLWITDNISE